MNFRLLKEKDLTMSGENDTCWNLLENLPEVPLRKVLKMLGKDDKKRLRLVSHR